MLYLNKLIRTKKKIEKWRQGCSPLLFHTFQNIFYFRLRVQMSIIRIINLFNNFLRFNNYLFPLANNFLSFISLAFFLTDLFERSYILKTSIILLFGDIFAEKQHSKRKNIFTRNNCLVNNYSFRCKFLHDDDKV